MMKALRLDPGIIIITLIIAAFVAVAAQRLGTVPIPEGDEAFTLQVPYEMLNRGKLALPMLRYLGGNIENVWHSYIPVYFVILSGFHELFGFGLVEGRAFNLMTAALTLMMIYLIGRRLFDWRAGVIAVLMLVGDQTFFERSRLLRDDYAAAAFALLAFYLYELAEERKKAGLYVASGLAAGAGVMSHTNMLYMIGAICLLILMRGGWRAFSSRRLYLFGASALAVMAYEIVYDLIDYKNFLLQNHGDDVHFRVLTSGGLWQNLLEERLRYLKWYTGGLMFPGLPQTTLRIFQLLTVVAIIYLVIRFAREIRRGNLLGDPRARLLVVTVVTVLFHALIVSNKRMFYLAHIVPWFALAVGLMLRDGTDWIARLGTAQWPRARLAYRAAIIVLVVTAIGYMSLLIVQSRRYLDEVRNPNLASFAEFTTAIREIVPEGLCPVAVKNPSVWLAFPEKDSCFATIENRFKEEVDADIDGKDYALVTRLNALPERAGNAAGGYHLLGEMWNTPYGNLLIYYTGTDPHYLGIKPKRYEFFGELGGYTSRESEDRN
ncbi:MAG TPA: glycosyltransferase family 39 protein [Blastocatellia bacterium]|nr:glycosyltransferase family 39 protein [Blastocatellia bacterium]